MGPVHFFLLDKYRPHEAFDLAFCNGVFHLKIVRVFHHWSTLLLSENIELREENGKTGYLIQARVHTKILLWYVAPVEGFYTLSLIRR